MNQDTNIHKTANFAVLSVSFEKADAETRGKFAFFDENIKNFENGDDIEKYYILYNIYNV